MNVDNLPARETFLTEVIVTAVEAGFHGIGYWADVQEYRWYFPDTRGGSAEPAPHGGGNAWATLMIEDEDGAPLPPDLLDLTPKTIAKAYKIIMAEDYSPSKQYPDTDWSTWVETPVGLGYLPSQRWVGRIIAARAANDAGEIDSADADMLVQLGLLGAVVFG